MAQIPARTSRPRQLTSKQTGDAWESTALDWLQSKGLHFIAANVRERGGEIDLIMREGSTTVFVEVRYRPACGLRATMGVLILWIAGSMC